MFTKSTTIVSALLVALIVIGMVVVMNGVGISLPHTSHCYNLLNAAGQVVDVVCQ